MAKLKEGKMQRITFCTKFKGLKREIAKAARKNGQSVSKFIEFSMFKILKLKI